MDNIENDLRVSTEQDCAVCLQKYHHPTKLPCGHIFCFLCVKGIAIQNKKCAMCRTEIPRDYLNNPVLLTNTLNEKNLADCDIQDYQWYYEGRNGWWKYDERSNCDLEAAYNRGERECHLLLAGALYHVDFQKNLQVRHNDHTKRRRVRRDTPTLPSKGIAGIKTNTEEPADQVDAEVTSETQNDTENAEIDEEYIVHEDLNSNASEQEDLIAEVARTFSVVMLREQDASDDENTS